MSFGENTQLVEVPEEQEAISLIRRLKSRRDGASADCRCAEDTVKLTSARAFDGLLRIMNHARDPLFRRHRFPAELIGYAVLAVFSVPAEPADGRGNAGSSPGLTSLRLRFLRLLRLKAGRWLENRKNRKNRTASRSELQSLNRKNRNNRKGRQFPPAPRRPTKLRNGSRLPSGQPLSNVFPILNLGFTKSRAVGLRLGARREFANLDCLAHA